MLLCFSSSLLLEKKKGEYNLKYFLILNCNLKFNSDLYKNFTRIFKHVKSRIT